MNTALHLALFAACGIAAGAACSVTAGAAESLQDISPLLLPDGALVQQTLAALTADPPSGPDPRLVAGPWGMADARDPALVRHWTGAFAALPQAAGILDTAYRTATARLADPWQRGAWALRFLPAAHAVQDLDHLADAAFDRGDLRGYLALCSARPDDPRILLALALSGGAAQVDATLALAPPGVPESCPRPATGDEHAGLTVTWHIAPDQLMALDPWQRPRWQRACDGQAEILTGPGGAVLSDRRGVRLVREDGTLIAAAPPALGDQQVAVAGSAAWFVHGTAIRRIAFADGAVSTAALPEAPLAPPLVRGADSLWLTRHELLLVGGGTLRARLRHGLTVDSTWRLAAQQERIYLLAPEAAYRVLPLATQLATAPAAQRVLLLVRAGRYRKALDEAVGHIPDEPATRRALLTAHLACGIAESERDAVLRLTDDAQSQALVLADGVLAGQPVDARLRALVRDHPELRLPAERTALAQDEDTWDHVLSGAVLLAASAEAPRYALDGASDATIITCTTAGGTFRWRNRWPAEPVPSGTPRCSLAQRGGYLVVSEGTSRLVVLDPQRGDVLGTVDCGQLDAEPAQATVLGRDAVGVLRVALLHPSAIDDHLTILASDGSATTAALPAAARSVTRLSETRVRVALTNGTSVELPEAAK